jgi:hypothetical protein
MVINPLRFKQLYKQKKYTQDSLAEKLNVTRPAVNQWIVKSYIPDKYLSDLVRVFGSDGVSQFVVSSIMVMDDQAPYGDASTIPFYDIDVSAGDLFYIDNPTAVPTARLSIPGLKADFVVPVHGHSMHPEISNGDWIAVQQITDFSFFNYGQKYLIVTPEQRLVKTLRRHDNDDFVLLLSCNKNFDPIDLPKKAIKQLYLIVQVLKREII